MIFHTLSAGAASFVVRDTFVIVTSLPMPYRAANAGAVPPGVVHCAMNRIVELAPSICWVAARFERD
jgi:hypothetical protein